MKKFVFAALVAVFTMSSGFSNVVVSTTPTTTDGFEKTCYYDVRTERGERIGGVAMLGVPDDVDCASPAAIRRATEIWNGN